MTNHPDPHKTDKPEGERTVPNVPKPLPRDEAEDKEDLVVTQDSGPFEGEAPAEPPPPSSSAVNLGRPGDPAQPGQTSSGEVPSEPWTDLLRESPDSGPGEPARFDDPADADMLRHAQKQEAAEAQAAKGDSAGMPPPDIRDSSRVDLGESASEEDELASAPHDPNLAGDDSAIFVAEAVAEPGEEPVPSQAEVFSSDSDVELAGGVHEVAAEPSSVDLGAPPVPSVEDSSGVNLGGSGTSEASLLDSSGLDLEGAVILDDEEPIPASAVDLGNAAEAVVVDSSAVLPPAAAEALPQESSQSDVFVGADVGPAAEAPPSSISGLDLGQPPAPVVQVDSGSGTNLGAGAEELDEDEVGTISLSPDEAFVEGSEGASSVVNLGMPLEEKGSDRDLIAEAVESGVDLDHGPEQRPETGSYAEVVIGKQPAAGPSDSAVDLGAPAVADDEEAAALPQQE
ncbi:MAG: hypothetical protein HYS12_23770, partial [Planctomycetes bacterium]|nr:hypothetical protein [Planctomycetota bacterium]